MTKNGFVTYFQTNSYIAIVPTLNTRFLLTALPRMIRTRPEIDSLFAANGGRAHREMTDGLSLEGDSEMLLTGRDATQALSRRNQG